MLRTKDLPEPLILSGRGDLPEFIGTAPTLEIAGELFINIGVNKIHINTLEELMPWDGSEKMEPGTMLPDKTNSSN